MSTRPRWKHWFLVATVVSLAAASSGCGTDDTPDRADPGPAESGAVESGTTVPGTASPDGADPDGEPALRLLTPLDGDVVDVPFVLYVDTDLELGESEDGRHQLHVWFGDDDAEPLIVTSANASVDDEEIDIPKGDTTLNVQLHTADQEPVGDVVSAQITIYDGETAAAGS